LSIFLKCLFAGSIFGLATTASADENIAAGQYGSLSVAIRDGRVYGVFSEARIGNGTDDAPQFSCIFLLQGRLTGSMAAIDTWFPGDPKRIAGTLDLGGDPGIRLSENQDGCAMTSGDMVGQIYPLTLDARHDDWIGTGIVTAARAVLRPKPIETPKTKHPYLVKFDPFAILESQHGWVRIAYLGETERLVSGWVREDEVSMSLSDRE
jgi:hypothetical protein